MPWKLLLALGHVYFIAGCWPSDSTHVNTEITDRYHNIYVVVVLPNSVSERDFVISCNLYQLDCFARLSWHL